MSRSTSSLRRLAALAGREDPRLGLRWLDLRPPRWRDAPREGRAEARGAAADAKLHAVEAERGRAPRSSLGRSAAPPPRRRPPANHAGGSAPPPKKAAAADAESLQWEEHQVSRFGWQRKSFVSRSDSPMLRSMRNMRC